MFRNLLTPLTSKFPFQLNTLDTAEPIAPIEEEPSPEDFDRDARIEEMRIVLEEMKKVELDLEDITQKLQVKLVVRAEFPGAPITGCGLRRLGPTDRC
jgi:hypothetical protein